MKIVKKKKSTENCHFYSREKSLYIVWACFRNESSVYWQNSPVQKALVMIIVSCNLADISHRVGWFCCGCFRCQLASPLSSTYNRI